MQATHQHHSNHLPTLSQPELGAPLRVEDPSGIRCGAHAEWAHVTAAWAHDFLLPVLQNSPKIRRRKNNYPKRYHEQILLSPFLTWLPPSLLLSNPNLEKFIPRALFTVDENLKPNLAASISWR
jgi:hypothetical protein